MRVVSAKCGDREAESKSLNFLGILTNGRGDCEEAVQYALQSLEIIKELGDTIAMAIGAAET